MFTKFFRFILATCLFTMLYTQVSAQGAQRYQTAVDLYNKGLYAESQQQLEMAKKETAATDRTLLANIDYYHIMCDVRLKQDNIEPAVEEFLKQYPESLRRNDVLFAVGLSAYNKNLYRDAAKWFTDVKPTALNDSEQAEFYFKYGYTLMKTNKTDQATKQFALVKDNAKSRYATSATYYYAHIAYENGSYAAALKHFERIKDETEFQDIVPFYIFEIHYRQKEYDKVLAEGNAVYQKATSERAAEIARIMADSYMQRKQYTEALSWFEKYKRSSSKGLSAAEAYQMSLANFELKRYSDAVAILEKQAPPKDTLGQNLCYLLAASYLQTNDKQKAMTAFDKAAKIGADKSLTMDAEFNYAKLAYELNQNTVPLKAFVSKYPNSAQQADVRNLLTGILISDKKFQDAIDLINQATNPNATDYANLQKATYFRGLEQFKNNNSAEADRNFNQSLKYASYDGSIAALTGYWKAENDYKQGRYDGARKGFTTFINSTAGVKNTAEYRMAHYTLGYTYFREKKYDDAITWFRKFNSLAAASAQTPYTADCYNRIGDCYFSQRKFDAAIESYQKAYDSKQASPDYSLFQTGISQGMAGNTSTKQSTMNKVISQFPKSMYVPAAWFELGRINVEAEHYADATKSFETILNSYKTSAYYPKALVEMGLIKLNINQDDAALAYYKQVVEKYPNSPEAQDALAGIKNIYIDKGSINDYFTYTASIGKGGTESAGEIDSLSFVVAERMYLQGDCDRSISLITKYLNDNPNGRYKTNASYYLGECLYRQKKYSDCLSSLSYVISQPAGTYTDDALIRYAKASWELEHYSEAAQAFARVASSSKVPERVLEAENGATRAFYLSNDYVSAANAATRLLANKGLDEATILNATFIKARSLQEIGQTDEAEKLYQTLAKDSKTSEGAESYYRFIELLFGKGDYDKTEKEVMKFSETKTPYAGWLARSFVILGDVYVKRGNYFQARETYKSIVNGYKNTQDGIVDEVNQRLKEIEGKS